MNKTEKKALFISSKLFDELKKRAKKKGRILHASYADEIVALGISAEDEKK